MSAPVIDPLCKQAPSVLGARFVLQGSVDTTVIGAGRRCTGFDSNKQFPRGRSGSGNFLIRIVGLLPL